jgi:hypothetical protein
MQNSREATHGVNNFILQSKLLSTVERLKLIDNPVRVHFQSMSDQAAAAVSPAKDENQNKDTPVSILREKFASQNLTTLSLKKNFHYR